MKISSLTKIFSGPVQQVALTEQLFDHLPDIVFFVKDLFGRYIVVNQTLANRCGAKNKAEIIGHTSVEVLGEDLGLRYTEQDQKVIKTEQPLVQFLEIHNYQYQELGWCLTTKLPVTDDANSCTGLIGISQDLKLPETSKDMFGKVHTAINYMEDNLEAAPSIRKMAEIAEMSLYQLDRRMKMIFGLSAGKWLLKTRISHAGNQLLETDLSVLEIAFTAGYSDQSAFTKQFKKITGFSPLKFKKINQKSKIK